jgi:DNA-binding MarR family transcriptional regulator
VAATVGIRAQRLSGEDDGRAAARAEPPPRLARVDLLERIRRTVHALEDEPGLTSRELAELNGLTRRNMSLLLLRLEEHGLVAREGRRWFPGPEPLD